MKKNNNKNSNQIPITKPNSRPRNMKKRKHVSNPSTSFTFKQTTIQKQTPLIQHQVIETDPLVTQYIFRFLSSLPPGYRFKPTDVELVRDYLRPKIANKPLPPCLIHPVNLYAFHPKVLAERHLKHPDGDEVYYFTPRDRKYKNGTRPNRGVDGVGYWKATGAETEIKLGDDEIIGYMRTLTFYEGLPKAGVKTNWIMHEYKSCESRQRTSNEDMKLDDWILCKIRKKEETGPSKSRKKNEKANVNTSRSDTDTENALIEDVNAVKDEDYETDYDEVDNFLNTSNDSTKEDNCQNPNNCGTLNRDELYQPNQGMELSWPHDFPYMFDAPDNLNAINGTCKLGGWRDNLNNSGPSCVGNGLLWDETYLSLPELSCGNGPLPDEPFLPQTSCRTRFLRDGSFLPQTSCGTGPLLDEPFLPQTSCGTGLLQNEPLLPQTSCATGLFQDEPFLPQTSCGTGLLIDDVGFYDPYLWESDKDIMGNNELGYWSVCEGSYNFQDKTNDLKINDADDEKQIKLPKT